ncbi:hypothetical protein [Laspinema olomoucense]|uniref:Uncharacterized protein n=1 Tax=Laspinema olomoucense D3b TaxID=2953688 RepID=A0ABT2NEF8_9CYAN|nr:MULTISPECIES: hypothetical protein [unclassified Laspinema]MCT7980249.1 hypothetical protein [Laspinema sp. D3b]MCT7996616.1 hypothetical protein [Laspinema sp. D3c]
MTLNKYRPHVLVLPEDDADRQIANGFILNPNLNNRAIQILPPSGGWLDVLHDVKTVHGPKMHNIPHRMLVLLIDFDQDTDRLTFVRTQIPETLQSRIFVLGVLRDPESLKRGIKKTKTFIKKTKTFEEIGEALAQDCADNQQTFWNHELLRHNHPELERLRSSVKPFLFE